MRVLIAGAAAAVVYIDEVRIQTESSDVQVTDEMSLQIGPQNVQISAISFSTTAHVAFYLNTFDSQYALQSGIARIP